MASTYLTKTFASAGSTTTWTWSAWIKKSGSSAQQLLSAEPSSVDDQIYFSSDQLIFYTGNQISLKTNRKFRDTSAWYHIVVQWNTPDATADDRHKIWVNGVQETSFETRNNPSQNANSKINGAGQHAIGAVSSSPSEYFDGSMAHVHFIDGTAYDADTFGETDATTGIWKPKTAPSVTYGTNGFFLKFENSAAFGTDSSGNGNTFTVNGTMTQTIDTPSNVFATFNPLARNASNTYSNGNLTYAKSGSYQKSSPATLTFSQGKYYAEFKKNATATHHFGIVGDTYLSDGRTVTDTGASWTYDMKGHTGTICLVSSAGAAHIYADGSDTTDDVDFFTTSGDIVMIAFDADTGKIWFGKNGTWDNSGDPAAGTNPSYTYSGTATTDFTFAAGVEDGNTINANFGNGYFGTTAVSSAQNPDDGIGIFEYDVPAGYRALCTKSINAEEYS